MFQTASATDEETGSGNPLLDLVGFAELFGDGLATPMASVQSTAKAASVSVGTAAQAAALQANPSVTAFTVSDTAANIAVAFDALNADTKLTGISVANGLPLPLTYTQYTTDTRALALLAASTTFALTSVLASHAMAVQAIIAVKSFAVADTAANIQAALPTLAATGKLATIAITGGSRLPVTYTQFTTYAATLARCKPTPMSAPSP
jgi:hypothetical protein